MEIQNQFCTSGLHASDGWLFRFKQMYGVQLLKELGEKLTSREDLVDPFKRKLQRVIREENSSHDSIVQEKKRTFLIGKAKKPRSFRKKVLPVICRYF